MKFSQTSPQLLNLFCGHKDVVMIWKNRPGMRSEGKIMTGFHERLFAFGHPVWVSSNDLRMFVASCRDQILMSSL